GVRDQVMQHLLQLYPVASHFRQGANWFDSYQYPVLLQISTHDSDRFPNKLTDVDRRYLLDVVPQVPANALDHRTGPVAVRDYALKRVLCAVEVGQRTVQKPQARIGSRYHRR